MKDCPLVLSENTYAWLREAYAQPHRKYHTQAHIDSMLEEFQQYKHLAERPDLVEAAIWFHDCVYDVERTDNEEASSAQARLLISKDGTYGIYADHAWGVEDLIWYTKHHQPPPTNPDACLICDLDLAGLGSSPEQYKKNSELIRKEFASVPDEVFLPGRMQFLAKMLMRKRIFNTEQFGMMYEGKAKHNIREELGDLVDSISYLSY